MAGGVVGKIVPITFDGNGINDVTIDGQEVQEITIDGQLAWKRSTLIDSFERGNLNPYQNIGGFSISSARSTDGSRSLRADGGDGNKTILSRSGLSYYPSRGDTIRFDVNFSGGGELMFGFFHGSGTIEEDSYEIEMRSGKDRMILYDDRGVSNRVQLASSGVNIPTNRWLSVEVETNGGGITVRMNGRSMSTNNTARSSGGILFGTDGVRGHFDNIHVT